MKIFTNSKHCEICRLVKNQKKIVSKFFDYIISRLTFKSRNLAILKSYNNTFNVIKTVIILFTLLTASALCQVDTVPVGHPVYAFLKELQVEGIIKNYDDVVLPLSRKKVIYFLAQADSSRNNLSKTDRDFLIRMEEKLGMVPTSNKKKNLFSDFPIGFRSKLISDSEKHIYSYKDSSISFYIDPVLEGKYIYSKSLDDNSTLFNVGAVIRGSYNGWLGFYLEGSNGTISGSRNVAELDRRVKQSFTFNNTKINFFDGTSGYIRLRKGIVNLELGRERVRWGNGYIDRTILSDNPPIFDFVKFGIAYKKFRYDFLHGWLEQQPTVQYIDSLVGNVKFKPSKYVAISRMGYQANDNLSFGLTQMIIYSDRPLELAYLNPFLFWESAQRSMNDLDNSFLAFDGRYKPVNGMELSSSIIFDDINFSYLFKGEWARNNNGNEWQVGLMLTDPILFEDMTFKLEYLQIRPYTFSHPGIGEALTYSNNGYLLGTNLQPNSTRLSAEINYRFNSKLDLNILYSHSLHGNNVYDQNGNLIENFGGNFLNNLSFYSPEYAYLLQGIREVYDYFDAGIQNEITYGYYFNIDYIYSRSKISGIERHDDILQISFIVNFE